MPAQRLVDRHSLKILNMEGGGIPSINSHQQLMSAVEDSDSGLESTAASSLVSMRSERMKESRGCGGVTLSQWVTIAILCFVNLINYMDRYTIAAILPDIQKQFQIEDDKAGLLQTAFVVSYMVFAPIFGYLGDRYNRKIIMAGGVLMWSLTTLAGSYMNTYGTFILFRSFVGIGEASYSTIAPTIISDMFVKEKRSQMLALFYFAIPIGSGLGYIVGDHMSYLLGSWHWGLRLTPALGVASVILIMCFLTEPVRGESEGTRTDASHHTFWEDIKLLCLNKSFMLSTAGFTCVAFVAGALAFFGPKFLAKGFALIPGNKSTDDTSFKFGLIAMSSGLLGVPLGPFLSQLLRSKFPRIDPLVCAGGLILSAPICFFAILTPSTNVTLCYMLIFLSELFLNLNWSIVADILLYVVPPSRRSTAEAYQILISHALGDASSPYLIGLVSESLKEVLTPAVLATNGTVPSPVVQDSDIVEFHSMQYALFITCFVEVLGGVFFLLTALYIKSDKEEAEKEAACDSLPEPTHFIADDPRER